MARALPDGVAPGAPRGAGHARGPAPRVAPAAAHRAADRDPRPRSALLARRRRASCWTRAGITLSDDGVALLHERTEGWAAGLRLAAISLAGHPDPERFVAEFSGSERTVAGYLLAEVLERQPPEVRDLLLRTSVLERVSGPLADALTGGTGSEAMLQSLEDANAFVTSLDVGRSWFRYHHLLADLLQLELRRSSAGDHRAAAPRSGAVVRGARVRGRGRSATRRRRATGRTPPACLPTTTWTWCSTAARRRCARCWTPSPPTRRRRMPSWRWRSRPGGSTTACWTRALPTSPLRSGGHAVPQERRRVFDLRLASARLWLACQLGDLDAARQAMRSFEAQSAYEPCARG